MIPSLKRVATLLVTLVACASCGNGGDDSSASQGSIESSLRFFGTSSITPDDRVKVLIDDPANSTPGPSADIGASDFTIEMWLRVASLGDNPTSAIACGANNNWVATNIFLDRDRHSLPFHYGAGLAGNILVFSVSNYSNVVSVCDDDGMPDIVPGRWQHVAFQRRSSDGRLWILADGETLVSTSGPVGDISYPDDGTPLTATCPFNGGDCVYSDPYLVFGAEKHGYSDISFNGWIDEIRLSTVLRYGEPAQGDSYSVPVDPFSPDASTAALYHLDSASGTRLIDATGENDGDMNPGMASNGPQWSTETPFD